MNAWVSTFLAVGAVSLLSLLGAAFLLVKAERIRRGVLLLVSFSVGALLGDVFLHLVPELAADGGLTTGVSFTILAGIGAFFVLEKLLHWHHAHFASEDVLHPIAVTNLVGDAIHNFVDGAIVAGAFLASPALGTTTTIAVALHEVPQELGDVGILMHSGVSLRRALRLNFLSALAAFVGAASTLVVAESVAGVERTMIALTAGGFVYIAGSDLIPELQRETRPGTSVLQLLGVAAGMAVMGALLWLE